MEGIREAINAEAKRGKEKKNGKEFIFERSWGRACRAFALPGDIDGNRTEARYDKDVLTLTLPKQANGNARRITVSGFMPVLSGRRHEGTAAFLCPQVNKARVSLGNRMGLDVAATTAHMVLDAATQGTERVRHGKIGILVAGIG